MTNRLAVLAAPLLFLLLQLPHLAAPPGGFHEWRESDTATVALSFVQNGFDFFAPRVNLLGPGETTLVGTELPIYNYLVALAYGVFGYSHVWPRLLSALSALLLAFSSGTLARRLDPNKSALRPLVIWLTLFNPLILFYGGRIQPDVMGLALTTTAATLFLGRQSLFRLSTACLCLAMAGGIKPTFFFVGLPMTVMLAQEQSGLSKAMQRPILWLFAAASLLPAMLWLAHARQLTERYGSPYFYLGQGWTAALQHLRHGTFYKHVLLIWPLELAVGLPLVPWFVYGLLRLKSYPGRHVIIAWIIGSMIVFAMAAGHCATSHDYYFLPILPALSIIVAHGILSPQRRQLLLAALALVALCPLTSFLRIKHRYAEDPEFWTLQQSAIPREALVLAIDPMPGFQLYRVGRRGYQTHPNASLAAIAQAWQRGARFLVHSQRNGHLRATTLTHLEEMPQSMQTQTKIFRIRESIQATHLELQLLDPR